MYCKGKILYSYKNSNIKVVTNSIRISTKTFRHKYGSFPVVQRCFIKIKLSKCDFVIEQNMHISRKNYLKSIREQNMKVVYKYW